VGPETCKNVYFKLEQLFATLRFEWGSKAEKFADACNLLESLAKLISMPGNVFWGLVENIQILKTQDSINRL
jgi:hypothetical protein